MNTNVQVGSKVMPLTPSYEMELAGLEAFVSEVQRQDEKAGSRDDESDYAKGLRVGRTIHTGREIRACWEAMVAAAPGLGEVDPRRDGEEAMRAAAIRAVKGFIMEAPNAQENRTVEAAVLAIQAIRTTELPKLADYQIKLLSRVETTDPNDFSDFDWDVMVGLRDLGLTCMKPHSWKKYIPFFGVYEARPALTDAGHEVLAANNGRI